MLETEEVDADYFTPASGTSLSQIFSNTLQTEDGQDNSSLKYVSPLPAQITPKAEKEKPTQCVYVTALYAYEWLKNSYVSKERVGFAIMKIIKSGLHNIVLYDSNKTTLSSLTLTTNSEINIKENVSISFYDNKQKYWSVYTNPYELSKILDILKELNICLKYPSDTQKDPTEKNSTEDMKIQQTASITTHIKNCDKESDTDSSINRRTKDSILKRMATMGQSVLPATHLIKAHTSDSSDTNDVHNQHEPRHKPFKTMNKRNVEKNIIEHDNNDIQIKNNTNNLALSPEINTISYQNKEQQIVAIKTVDITKSPINAITEGNDMPLFMSEQRVSNTELRINMSRMTDKLDLVLDKVKILENVDRSSINNNSSQFQKEITYKLLNEYEKKIQSYEDFMKSKGFHCDTFEPIDQSSNLCNVVYNNVKPTELCNCKQLCEEKDKQISQLNEKVQMLSSKLDEIELKNNEGDITKEKNELLGHIMIQNDQINNLNKKLEVALSNEDVTDKLKGIMNETFHNISINFDGNTSYTGANVKSTVASVIKKTTIDCLK